MLMLLDGFISHIEIHYVHKQILLSVLFQGKFWEGTLARVGHRTSESEVLSQGTWAWMSTTN